MGPSKESKLFRSQSTMWERRIMHGWGAFINERQVRIRLYHEAGKEGRGEAAWADKGHCVPITSLTTAVCTCNEGKKELREQNVKA